MALPRAIRLLAAATICVFLFLFLQMLRAEPGAIRLPDSGHRGKESNNKLQKWDHDPQLDRTSHTTSHLSCLSNRHGTRTLANILALHPVVSGEPPEPLRRVKGSNYDPDNAAGDRINATILSLVRNEELQGILDSMSDLERTWNRKFNYPWTFFNDVPFTEEFKQKTTAATKAKTYYRAYLTASPFPAHSQHDPFSAALRHRNM